VNLDAGVLEQARPVLLPNQVERAKGEPGISIGLSAVRKQMHLGLLERCRRLGTRQHGDRQMRRRRHDVGGHNRPFHHLAVDRSVIAAGPPVTREQRMVRRRDQRAGSAREIARPKSREGRTLAPVCVDQSDSQFREQRR